MIDPPDPRTYHGQPIERWKMVMVEHIKALRDHAEKMERERNAANARCRRLYREGDAHSRADKLQRRLDEAQNTIAHLQRRLLEVQGLNKPMMKEAI